LRSIPWADLLVGKMIHVCPSKAREMQKHRNFDAKFRGQQVSASLASLPNQVIFLSSTRGNSANATWHKHNATHNGVAFEDKNSNHQVILFFFSYNFAVYHAPHQSGAPARTKHQIQGIFCRKVHKFDS